MGAAGHGGTNGAFLDLKQCDEPLKERFAVVVGRVGPEVVQLLRNTALR